MNAELLKIIERQRQDWEKKRTKAFVPRRQQTALEAQLPSALIKVIIGPRRAGKSVLAAMALRNRKTAYLNFDEPYFLQSVDTEDLLPALSAVYGVTDFYFFDEIQNLPGWELWLNRLQREGRNVIVSGSNAKLLSGELSTHLTGRHLVTEVLPFSFPEYSAYHGRADAAAWSEALDLSLLTRFLKYGGYPQIVTSNIEEPQAYLSTLVEASISRDVADRHDVRKRHELRAVADWVFSNVAHEMTFNRLSSADGRGPLPSSPATVKKFLDYLQEAFLLTLVTRFEKNHRERLKSPRKAYAVDNGVATVLGTRASEDLGKLLENAVCAELRKSDQGCVLKYFRSTQGAKEVDFVRVRDGAVTELIEVTWRVDDERSLRKKVAALRAASEATGCAAMTVVTWLDERIVGGTPGAVRVVPFYKWAFER